MILGRMVAAFSRSKSAAGLDRYAERQLASNDCGLAVCKTALNIAGVAVPRHELRERMSFDEEGSSFEDVKRALGAYRVDSQYRVLELGGMSLSSLKRFLPCIVMIEAGKRNHYLLLHSVTATGVNILDPQKGHFEEKGIDFLRDNLSRVTSATNEEVTLAFVQAYVRGKCEELNIPYKGDKSRSELVMDYNKVAYLESLERRVGFRSDTERADYLRELFSSKDDSVVPSRFKTFRVDAERLVAKTPLALCFSASAEPVQASGSGEGESIQALFRMMLKERDQRANLKRLFYIGSIVSALALVVVYANQILIDEVIPTRELATLYAFVGVMLLLRLFELSQNLLKSYIEVSMGKTMDDWLCRNLHEKLVYSTFESIGSYNRGELSLRLNDLLRIKSIVAVYLNDYLFSIVTLSMAVLLATYVSIQVGAIIMAVSACYAFILSRTVGYVKSLESQKFSEKSRVVNSLINIVEGHGVIAKNRCEPSFLDDQRIKVGKFLDVQFRSMLASQLLVYIPRFIAIIGSLSVVLIASKQHILDRSISIGQIFTLISLSEVCFMALRTILRTRLMLQEQAVVVDRYFDLLGIEQRPEVLDDPARVGSVELSNIGYQFPASSFRIDVPELRLRAGDRVLISGSNGAGKSTLLKILAGLIQKGVTGSMLFTSSEGLQMSRQEGLAKVALIRAEDKIFSETIGFNITLSNDRGGKKIYEYAKRVGAEDFISPHQFPLDTIIHDQGANLSTGQRRKLLILRILFSRADVIIFDEIFRGIDNASKRKIIETLAAMPRDKIIIYTTHEDLDGLEINRHVDIVQGKAIEINIVNPKDEEVACG